VIDFLVELKEEDKPDIDENQIGAREEFIV
jgi:hypothetical protein